MVKSVANDATTTIQKMVELGEENAINVLFSSENLIGDPLCIIFGPL